MMTAYHATQIQFPIAIKRGDPIEVFDAVLINVGATMIQYKEAIAMVTKPTVAYTPMSITIHKSQVDPKVYDNLKNGKNFTNYLEQVICKDWLVPEATAKTANLGAKAITINGEVDEIHYGLFFVYNEKAHSALKRSGQKGVTIGYKAYDETTSLITLPKKTTMKQALEMSKLVGELSMGIVYKSIFNGSNSVWTLRILKDDANEKKAKSLLDPELATTVGALMTTPLSQGRLYEVRNLDSAWDLRQIVKTIAETGWNIRPERFIKSTSRSSNNVLVFATTPPRQFDIKVNGSTRWLSIITHEPPKPKKNAWDIVFTKHNAELKGQQCDDEPTHWPGQTENEYLSRNLSPAWMKARHCSEMNISDDESNAAENYDASYEDEVEQQALLTADAMNISVDQASSTAGHAAPGESRRAAPATPIAATTSAYVPTSSYDAIKAEWRKRTDESNAEMERISNLQKAQFEEMQKMVAKVEAVFEEKLASICKDMMSAMDDVREKSNAAQLQNQTAFTGLAASIALLGAQMARMETEGKRGAQDDATGVRTRQRTSITTDEMAGSIADAA
jgi:hypothetical protein